MVSLISYSTVVNYYVWLLRLALDGEGKINIEILLLCGAAKQHGESRLASSPPRRNSVALGSN